LFWVILAVYISWKKDSLLEKARMEINARIGGNLRIGNLDISLFRHFPAVTLSLTDVSLRDSAWGRHGHDLLKAGRVYIACSVLRSLIHGRVELSTVFVENATLYFYTDSSGYSNTYLLKGRGAGGAGEGQQDRGEAGREQQSGGQQGQGQQGGNLGEFPTVVLSDVRWVMDRQDQHKLFDLDVRRLTAVIKTEDRVLRFDVSTMLMAKSFSFKTEKGSFLRDKLLTGHFGCTYNLASHILQTEKARLDINGYPFVLSGRFFPTVKPDPFFLTIDVERIPFKVAIGLLTPQLEQKLNEYDIDKPVAIHVQLDAGAADNPQPQIQVRLNLDKGGVQTPAVAFADVSFKGSFTNEWVRGQGHDDGNSGMRFMGFTGRLGDISLHADSILITDLVHPQLSCDLHSRFGIAALNDVLGSQTLQFRAGTGEMDVRYKGPLSENDTTGATVNGQLKVDSGAMVYLPVKFQLTDASGLLLFRDQDMIVDRLEARAGNTRVRIKGVAKNLITLIDHNSESVSMDWSLSTGHLALEDFTSLIGKAAAGSGGGVGSGGSGGAGGSAVSADGAGTAGATGPAGSGGSAEPGVAAGAARRKPGGPAFGTVAARIDNFLKNGMIRLRLDAENISYEDFSGARARADLTFRDGEIRLSQLTVQQSSGTLGLKATLLRRVKDDANPLTLESHLEGVDLPGLFRSFDNFGLKGIGAHNLKGRMNADVRLTGLLTNNARVVANSLKGTIDFSISDGQLIDFEPMEKIHETVLKKRDMSEVRFGTLQNSLNIDSTTVTLHRMEIESTAFTLYAEGTYDLRKGADMSLQVPLSNLKTRAEDVPPESRGNDSKGGLSLHLRAKTDDDGKLKISWDPFRKALKKAKKAGR
jgi:hypothetical protein